MSWRAFFGMKHAATGSQEHSNCMPPKRPLPTNIDEQSPPPTQRSALAVEHHLSPMAGHHPEIPADAAVAISTPPRRHDLAVDIQPQPVIPSENICPNVAGQRNTAPVANAAATTAPQPSPAMQPASSTATNNGARAAYTVAQQQRVITCNLATIPMST